MPRYPETTVTKIATADDQVEAADHVQDLKTSAPATEATNMASNTNSAAPRAKKYVSSFTKRCSETARFRRVMRAKYPATVDLGRWIVENGVWVWTEGGIREQDEEKAERITERQDSFLVANNIRTKDDKSSEPSPLAALDFEDLDANQLIDELDQAFVPTLAKWESASSDED